MLRDKLIDISINTMIGNLPQMMNKNNQYVCEEFDSIRTGNKMTLDVSCNNVAANNATFNNLRIGSTTFTASDLNGYKQINSSIISLKESIDDIKTKINTQHNGLFSASVQESVNEEMVYGAPVKSESEYDMSSFFSTTVKGSILGVTVNDLYTKKLYRIVDGIKIPLYIGSMIIGSKLRLMVYHDHIDTTGFSKIVERVYSTVTNGTDGNSVIQYGSAGTVMLGNQ